VLSIFAASTKRGPNPLPRVRLSTSSRDHSFQNRGLVASGTGGGGASSVFSCLAPCVVAAAKAGFLAGGGGGGGFFLPTIGPAAVLGVVVGVV
jgi:hypothetical protein